MEKFLVLNWLFTADDIDIDFLANVVKKISFRQSAYCTSFYQGMVTNYKKIKTVPEVQVVMDMDGFGAKF
jgi:hypothetical protein